MLASPPVVRYPKPCDYRNPYVGRRRGPGKKPPRLCEGCSVSISREATRCHRCAHIHLVGGNVGKVRELAATGEYKTMSAIAAVVRLSRERVRQIIRQHDIPWQANHVTLEWECPGCGNWISVWRSEWEARWNHMPAHCRSCRQEDKERFCKRGHLRSEGSNVRGGCLACFRLKAKCVVETRTCEICHRPLSITDGMRKQALYGHGVNKYHRRCWAQKLGRERGRRTHCKRGHEFTEENTYRWRETRQCRACIRIRDHLRASR